MSKDKQSDPLELSVADLKRALDKHGSTGGAGQTDARLAFLAVAKAFEVAVEYAWKHLKRKVVDEGLDPQSPKAAVRDAARIGMLDNPDDWLTFINARNEGVHDYFSMSEKEYVGIATEFLAEVTKLLPTQ